MTDVVLNCTHCFPQSKVIQDEEKSCHLNLRCSLQMGNITQNEKFVIFALHTMCHSARRVTFLQLDWTRRCGRAAIHEDGEDARAERLPWLCMVSVLVLFYVLQLWITSSLRLACCSLCHLATLAISGGRETPKYSLTVTITVRNQDARTWAVKCVCVCVQSCAR